MPNLLNKDCNIYVRHLKRVIPEKIIEENEQEHDTIQKFFIENQLISKT